MPVGALRRAPPGRPSGWVHVRSLATGETLRTNIYASDGSYDPVNLGRVRRLFRCRRTTAERNIDPRLVVLLSWLYDQFGRPLELVSGYRKQRRTTSHHFTGTAADVRIPGVSIERVRDFLATLDAGGLGIGLYPRSRFVHVDVRPPPSYRWIDWSGRSRSDRDRPPPRRRRSPSPQS